MELTLGHRAAVKANPTDDLISDNSRRLVYACLARIFAPATDGLGNRITGKCCHAVDRYVEGLRMQLRSHPMMVYRGRPNWPPQWNWISGPGNTESAAVGEAGALEHVQLSHVPGNTIFLTVETSDGNRFTGQLAFDDDHFARKVLSVLHEHFGKTIKDIAGIEIA